MREERFLRQTALYSFAVMMIVVMVAGALRYEEMQTELRMGLIVRPTETPSLNIVVIPTSLPLLPIDDLRGGHSEMEEAWDIWNVLLTGQRAELDAVRSESCIVIKKTEMMREAVLNEELLTHTITMKVMGTEDAALSAASVMRLVGADYYLGVPEYMLRQIEAEKAALLASEAGAGNGQGAAGDGNGELRPGISEIEAGTVGTGSGQNDLPDGEGKTTTVKEPDMSWLLEKDIVLQMEFFNAPESAETEIRLLLNNYYLPELVETEEYYVINLRRPKELYKKIVVVDAGHGGNDPGAGAEKWTVTEAGINLKLLLYLKEYLDADPEIQAFYTRTTNVRPSLAQRVELANGVDADLFISFHCNSTVQSRSNGTEVHYNAEQGAGEAFNSREFAKICLNNVVEVLGTKSGGIIKRPDLHIVRRAEMPVVLLETAYLSNPGDLAVLKDDEKLRQTAEAVYRAILTAYERMEATE